MAEFTAGFIPSSASESAEVKAARERLAEAQAAVAAHSRHAAKIEEQRRNLREKRANVSSRTLATVNEALARPKVAATPTVTRRLQREKSSAELSRVPAHEDARQWKKRWLDSAMLTTVAQADESEADEVGLMELSLLRDIGLDMEIRLKHDTTVADGARFLGDRLLRAACRIVEEGPRVDKLRATCGPAVYKAAAGTGMTEALAWREALTSFSSPIAPVTLSRPSSLLARSRSAV